MKGLRFFILLSVAVLLATPLFFAAREFMGALPMKCRQLKPTQMDEERAEFERRPRYVLGEKGRAVVHFQFNLDAEDGGETLFVILSNRMGALVYRGPYRRSLSLEMDANLAADDGYDNLEFWLLQLGQKQICGWANERGYPYWRPGADISIEFLREGGFGDDGLFKQHDVTIR